MTILTSSDRTIALLHTWAEFIQWPCITLQAFCLSNSQNTNTTNTRPAAAQLLLSLSQWGVGQTSVDSGVAPVRLMIHTQCFANLRVSTHTSAHASPASQPLGYCATIRHQKLSSDERTHERCLPWMHTRLLCNIWISQGQYDSALCLRVTNAFSGLWCVLQ